MVLDTYEGPYLPPLLVVEVLDVKTTYTKSCALNLLVGPDLTLDPSFKVECGPRYLYWPISPLLLVVEVLVVKMTYGESSAPNLMVGSHLTLGPFFKVECGP